MDNLDHFDIKILSILQEDNLLPQRDIGEKIGLSAAAVQRRIKRMRKAELIQKDTIILDREKIGQPITLIVEVELENEKINLIDEAKSIFTNTPEVQQCYYVTGDSDFILIILVSSMQEYEALTRRIFFSNKNVKQFKTSVTLDIVKLGMNIPLPKAN